MDKNRGKTGKKLKSAKPTKNCTKNNGEKNLGA